MFFTDILSGLITLLLIVIFIGICLWAYSGKRREDFQEASQLPLLEDGTKEGYGHD